MTPSAVSGSTPHTVPQVRPEGDIAAYSRYVQRVRRRYADWLAILPSGPLTPTALAACYTSLQGKGLDCGAALRVLRQLVVERLACLDCAGHASLEQVTRTMTWLAELALDTACAQVFSDLDLRHGKPQAPGGVPARLWVVGMGKLGARELNVSSDIDLIYIYDHDGQTSGVESGRASISNHEYFALAVRGIHALIGEVTEHGFVFRVDLALRPNGNSGPSVASLEALDEYFQVQGREWERFAWLKSRVVAPAVYASDGSALALRGTVLPFVFRRYLDYSVFDSLRVLHAQIRSHAMRRAAGRPQRTNDVKLSRGGIREIEFTVQLLQVVRGGQFPELRTRPTLDALQRMVRAGLMQPESADALAAAYRFLRRAEHRIQYLDDQQTHILPTQDDDLAWIARTMGYGDCCEFLSDLDTHRERVAQEFDRLLASPAHGECTSGACGGPRGHSAAIPAEELDAVLERLTGPMAERAQAWRNHPRVLVLRDESRLRLARLVQRTADWVADDMQDALSADQRKAAGVRWLDWMETLLRRESYLALLQERPAVHRRLLRLLGSARWPARYLMQHPGVIDELADDTMLGGRFDATRLSAELESRRDALRSTAEDDDEQLLNLLRRAHHAEVFRTLARDVEGRLTVEEVADDLSKLADTLLRITSAWCWQRLKGRHRDFPRFGIVGYGKLGGKELGYGSDLDIVFVYEDADDRAPEVYSAFARKLINWLTVKTGEGDLFEIDTALRPNGNSGLLVTRFQAYADYQQQRGSNVAWTWEHQAMTRARFVLGSSALEARFDEVREAVICSPRDPAGLRDEIQSMRAKVQAAHPAKSDLFDIKHGKGGMVDAEFAVQFLVLAFAANHPGLRGNKGNIALLLEAEACGLLADKVGSAAAQAYRVLRQWQHAARLDERSPEIDPLTAAAQREAILRVGQSVFGGTPAGLK